MISLIFNFYENANTFKKFQYENLHFISGVLYLKFKILSFSNIFFFRHGMLRLNSKVLVAIVSALAFIAIIVFTNQQTSKDDVTNYITMMQNKLYKQILTSQIEATEHVQKNTTSIEKVPREITPLEIINFMRLVRQQMTHINKTIRNLREWSEYKDYNRKLHENFKLSPAKSHTVPHVIIDDVNLDCKTEYDVIFLVTSFAGHFERRAWIRDSWGASQTWLNKKKWKVIFNVGAVKSLAAITNENLKKESAKFKDLLVLDIPEDFHKLSQKVMVALNWVYQKSSFKFVLKTDDDIFIHVDRVMRILTDTWSNEDFIGHAMLGQPAERNKGRYGVTLEEWPGKTYDPYCSGGGYMLSNLIIGKMIPHFNWAKPLKIDDAYIGHLVKLAGGHPLHAPHHFLMWNDHCQYTDQFLVSHPAKTADCRDFFMTKALMEMGKVKKEGHKYQNVTSAFQYKQMLKKKLK